MTRIIPAIYENGVFRPVEPVGDLPDHARVQVTVDSAGDSGKRVFGLNRGAVLYIAPDFDAPLDDTFWLGESES